MVSDITYPINMPPPNNYDPHNAILLEHFRPFSKTYKYVMFTTVVAIVYHTDTVQSSVLRSFAFNFPTLMFHYCTVSIPAVSTKLNLPPLTFTQSKYHPPIKNNPHFLYIHTRTPPTSAPSPEHLRHLTRMATATPVHHRKPEAFRERERVGGIKGEVSCQRKKKQ